MTMLGRIALAVVRIYPRQWRERYASEMRDLLETTAPDSWTVIDLARGCASEWVRDSGPARAFQALVCFFGVLMAVYGPAVLLAPYLRRFMPEPPIDFAIVYGISFAFLGRHLWRTFSHARAFAGSWRDGWSPNPPLRYTAVETRVWRWALVLAAMMFYASPYFTSMRAAIGGLAFLSIPTLLIAQIDFHAHRSWFPHPGRIYQPRRQEPPARPLNL